MSFAPRPLPSVKDPRPWAGPPVVGGLPGLARNPAAFCLKLAQRHPGELVRVPLGPSSTLVASNPDHIEHVLLQNPSNYWKGKLFNALRPVFGDGLLLSEGETWRAQRTGIQPWFHRRSFRELLPELEQVVDGISGTWRDGAPVDVERAMRQLTMRVVSRMMFSDAIPSPSIAVIEQAFEVLLRRSPLAFATAFLPGARRLLLGPIRATLDGEVEAVIAARRRRSTQPQDLLTHLLEHRDAKGNALSDSLIRDQIITTLFGGYETTATALHWMWILLDRHPEVRERVQAEIDKATDPEQLPYGRQVIQETLRLMPPFWSTFRTAYEDDVCDGYRIRAGESLILAIYAVHRDPSIWPEPERFDPDRFAPDRKPVHRAAFMPFSLGTRACIGRNIALGEMALALWSIGRRWRLELENRNWKLNMKVAGSIRPAGAPRMRALRRAPRG